MSHITILLVSLFCEQKLIEQMRESDFCEGKEQYKYQPPVPVDFSNPVSPPSEAESCTLLSLNFAVCILYVIITLNTCTNSPRTVSCIVWPFSVVHVHV